jgi:(p)ppGpp synthase/HD superfamily hydrolase
VTTVAEPDPLLLARAFDFACRSHAGQRRKGSETEPYVNHVADVARRVAEATGGRDAALIAAALLHDTIEDCGATESELAATFGPDVAALVAEVTDDPSLSDDARRERQVEDAPSKSPRAKMLKLADKASNLRSIEAGPPGWPDERRRAYADWAARVAAGLGGANERLERELEEALAAVRRNCS